MKRTLWLLMALLFLCATNLALAEEAETEPTYAELPYIYFTRLEQYSLLYGDDWLVYMPDESAPGKDVFLYPDQEEIPGAGLTVHRVERADYAIEEAMDDLWKAMEEAGVQSIEKAETAARVRFPAYYAGCLTGVLPPEGSGFGSVLEIYAVDGADAMYFLVSKVDERYSQGVALWFRDVIGTFSSPPAGSKSLFERNGRTVDKIEKRRSIPALFPC